MRTEKDYEIQVRTNAPMMTSIVPIDEKFYDENSEIEFIGDEEGNFHYSTKEEVMKELERLKSIQPIRIPTIRFRIIETIINVGDWI